MATKKLPSDEVRRQSWDIYDWAKERYGAAATRHVMLINTHLAPYDDPEARLYALQEFEGMMRGAARAKYGGEHQRKMVRALAIWRLYQQIVHCDD